MAREKLTFMAVDLTSLPQDVLDNLAIIDEAKKAINATLGAARGEGWKAQHSYKLDFAEGKRLFKVAFFQAAAPKASGVVKRSLADMIAEAEATGSAH